MPLSAFDLRFLVREWQALTDARVNKVWQSDSDKKRLLVELHRPREGRCWLLIHPPDAMHLTAAKGSWPATPPGFCLFLRKHLEGGRLRAIAQLGFERIVRLDFEGKEARVMYVELFSKGNVILCDADGKILSLAETQTWADRTLRGGIPYQLPPAQPDVPALSEAEFLAKLRASRKDNLAVALAVDLGLSGRWAEEVLRRARVDKTLPPTAAPTSLFAALRALFDAPVEAVEADGAAYPVPFLTLKAPHPHASFNAALDAIVAAGTAAPKESQARSRLLRILAEQ